MAGQVDIEDLQLTCNVVVDAYGHLHHSAVARQTAPRRIPTGATYSQNELVRELQRTPPERRRQILRKVQRVGI